MLQVFNTHELVDDERPLKHNVHVSLCGLNPFSASTLYNLKPCGKTALGRDLSAFMCL